MAVLQPERLLEQADHLLIYRSPSQEDLRRAVSASYYAVFHLICTVAADLFAGKTQQKAPAYALVYRSFDHAQPRKACVEVQSPTSAVTAIVPAGEARDKLIQFAAITVELQRARNQADYDPLKTYSVAYAQASIRSARSAVALYDELRRQRYTVHRTALLMLLMFKRR